MRIYLILLAALLFGSTLVLAQEPPQSATASPSIYDEAYLSLWAKRLAFMQAASTRLGRANGKYQPPTTPAGKRIRSSDAMSKGQVNPSFIAKARTHPSLLQR